jgi:integrase/recombinase XerD
MGLSVPKTPHINLTKYVNIGNNQWRFCPIVIASNGRIKPDYVLAAGKPELHREGAYYLEWYENGSRHRRSVGKNAIEAHAEQQRQIQLLRNKALGIEVVPEPQDLGGKTVSESAAEFLEEVRQRSRRKTYQQYSVALRYFQECCGDKQLSEIGRGDLLKLLAFMREEKKLSNRTAETKLTVVVQWLKANGITSLLKRGDSPRYVEAEPEAYSIEELERFLAACNPLERIIFEFFWMTGFRDQEVQHVMRADLDLKEQVVRVREKPQWGFIPKDWEQREVPIPDRLVASLKSFLSRQESIGPLLFPTAGGLPNYHYLRLCKKIAWRAKLNCGNCEKEDQSCANSPCCDNWYLHKFRSTFATMHLQAGVDIRTVQQWMGHKDLASTMRYLKPARGKGVLEKVNNTFGIPGPVLVKKVNTGT